MNFRQSWVIVCLLLSSFMVLVSVILSLDSSPQTPIGLTKTLTIILLAQFGSSILFPLLVGYFYDKLKRAQDAETIWGVFRDLAEGGIIRIYKDREESSHQDNALASLRDSFESIRSGEVRLVGVSLRVFFNQTGPFYRSIYNICSLAQGGSKIGIRALLSHPEAPEVSNRAEIETPGQTADPLIQIDIRSTLASIENLNRNFISKPVHHSFYKQAPYCTCILFPDKCFFSPNLLSVDAPVRLPMIVFQKDSHGYRKLDEYFEFLWKHQVFFSGNGGGEILSLKQLSNEFSQIKEVSE